MADPSGFPSQPPPSQPPDADTGSSSSGLSRSSGIVDACADPLRTGPPSRRPVVAGEPPPRLNVGVFSKHKGVRYHRDGQVRSCRFCEILRTRAEQFLFEDEHLVVFRPLRPVAPSHVLIVPRAHIRNVNQLARQHRALLLRMKPVADDVVAQHHTGGPAADEGPIRVRASFHVPPFNSIDHVHMHAFVDDEAALGVYGRLKYRTESWWCRSLDDVLARLEDGGDGSPMSPVADADAVAAANFPLSSAAGPQPHAQLQPLTA